MASKLELMGEAYKRGILPEQYKPMFEEAIRRGLVPGREQQLSQTEQGRSPAPSAEDMGLQLETPGVDLDDMPGYRGAVESTEKAMRNLPRSFMEEGGAMVDAAMHPWETTKSLARVGAGAAQKGVKAMGGDIGEGYIPYADAVGQVYSDRYGSLDKARKTYEENPVALMGDLATLFTGGGAAARAAGLSKAGKAAQVAGRAFDPLAIPELLAGKGISATGRALNLTPTKLYEGAMKIPARLDGRTLRRGEKEELLRYGLDHGYVPTDASVDRLLREQSKLGDELGAAIDARTKKELSGKVPLTINGAAVAEEALNRSKQLDSIENSPTRLADEDKLIASWVEASDSQPGMLTTRQAQQIKKNAQDHVKWNRKASSPDPVKEAYLKQYQHVLREKIAQNTPEAVELNKQLADIHAFQPALEGAVSRIGNRDAAGLGTTGGALSGGALGFKTGGDVSSALKGAATGAIAGTLAKNPVNAARLAIVMHKLKPVMSGGFTGSRARTYARSQAAKAEEELKKRSLLDLLAEEDEKKKK